MSIAFSPSKLAFYDLSLQAAYVAAGTWPMDAITISDPTWHQYIQPPPAGQVLGTVNGQPAWIAAPARTTAQATAALQNLKVAKQSAGITFTPTGGTQKLFPTMIEARANFAAIWSAIQAGLWADGTPIEAADGAPVAMSATDAAALIKKALAYVASCAATYATHYAAVQSDPTHDITTGWPPQ